MRLLVTWGATAHEALAERADAEGAGLRHRVDVALRHRGPEGHGPEGREDPARRVQEGHGGPDPHAGDGEVRPGPDLHVQRGIREVRARQASTTRRRPMARLAATQKLARCHR